MQEDEARGVLFILNESLVNEGGLSGEHEESLEKIISLTDEDPSLLSLLDDWKFIERNFPYLIRNSKDRQKAFGLAIKILQLPNSRLPVLFMTRKGGFLLSEILYESMESPQYVISFCCEAIKKSSLFPGVLYDCGFFILLNSLVSSETARLYSLIFEYKVYEARGKYEEDRGEGIMHEIKRRHFDSEVVFKDKMHFTFRKPSSLHKVGQPVLKNIFDDIYNTTFFDLLDLGLDKNLHLMNYCEWDYLFLCGSSGLKELVNSGSYLAIRLYRKMLESLGKSSKAILYLDKIEDSDLMIHVAKLLECKDTNIVMECGLVLYNYYYLFDWNLDKKQFNENKIRKIFSLLEYSYVDCSCFQECAYSQSDCSVGGLREDEWMGKCFQDCNTAKILRLLSNIYSFVDKRYFYKPSFLVLMKTWRDVFERHRCWNSAFFTTFFEDMVLFLRSNSYNIARIIFPFKRTRRKASNDVDEEGDKENSINLSILEGDGDIGWLEIEGLDELK
ncbi:uncharacterized protein Eint_020240 [Encephalitozoon intestinalis ATCC 50506]|uniref:Uncharacterized protein n=1 Tax=Encephalitozoon intestinalis (strain ATCC 50506) TaxID=876142 RepID=E0S5P0_ENCIT|nr:uncharacterized protein Eint_020240 [Encephalitozoon intestinalis ATCC 50506]ADM11025.1 hypothetical protein Eint_020240 [Encephalitozoon intestinalis ATCC 50506]UTX44673.1 hypothetical protein GPK93_02g01880 [Encephalitozoon intestinalis]